MLQPQAQPQSEMTPNGNWTVTEKGTVISTPRFDWLRKNRLFLILLVFAICIFILMAAAGVSIYFLYIPQEKKNSVVENPCNKMLCTFGSQCLVDESTNRAYCRCGETCSDVFAPVCSNDGVTYSSECQLRLSSCTQQRRIFVLRQGPCDIQDPCEKLDCQFGSFCKPSIDGQTARCVCSEECSHHGNDQNPVCGTDGKNYPNVCELKKASCRQMRIIDVKFEGVCDPCDGVECPTSQVCQLDESRNPICRCNSVCSPDFRPMCGSDGRTYTNECTLRVEACKSRKNIRIIYTGECSSGANPCDNLQCSPYQNCDIDIHGIATCQCDDACEPAGRLVCGSDEQTYLNECEMRRQGCLQKKSIKLAYRGECGERGPCYQYRCEFGAMCVLKGGIPTCECPTCTEEFEPVCGTDGISYTNKCKLRREACEQETEIAVAYSGLCTGCENKRCEYYAVCESDGRGNGRCVCPKTCIKVESLVCGTDEVTYQNECEMRIEACRKAQYVMVVSKGPCNLCRHVHCKYGARCEEGKCVCPTDCPKVSETVCANDGVTYRNECEMRHAACLHDQELNMLFYGECDEAGESQDEGSGAEIDCEERTCKYGGVCEYNMDGISHCVCNFQCPTTLDPVCGSDGKLYENECKLKEESCNLQKNVMAVHIEMCEEFREVPCAGEMPLVDPSTNKDYYCGEGIGSKLCPPGSYCHKSSAFSKCCREVILIKTCSESLYGCCPDGKTSAQGPLNAGCPSICNCNRLGSYGLTCEPISKQCFCKPGVGGPRCDRCEPGYWGLHRITEESNDGCSPCTCNLYGSVRDDCEQMTGRCVCKPGIQGMKCDICPEGTILGPDGCMDKSIAQPVSGSCDDLFCFHGAECRETEDNQAQCICDFTCSPEEKKDLVCGSDGNTYGSECQMKLFSCRYQKTITVEGHFPCPEDLKKNKQNAPIFLKLSNLPQNRKNSLLTRNSRSRSSGDLYRRNNRHIKKGNKGSRPLILQKTSNSTVTKTFDRLFVDVEFVPLKNNGVVFYCDQKFANNSVYLLLTIRDRILELRIKGLKETTILRSSVFIIVGKIHLVSIRNYPQFTVMYLDKKWVDMKAKTENYMTREESLNIFTRGIPKYFQRNETLGFHLNSVGYIHSLRIVREERHENITNNKIPSKFSFLDLKNKSKILEIESSVDFKLSAVYLERTSIKVSVCSRLMKLCSWTEILPRNKEKKYKIILKDGRICMYILADGMTQMVQHPKLLANGDELHTIQVRRLNNRVQLYLDGILKSESMKDSRIFSRKFDHYSLDFSKQNTINSFSAWQGCGSKIFINGTSLEFSFSQRCYSDPS